MITYNLFLMTLILVVVNSLSAEWIDNTTLDLKWEPVQATEGATATYVVNYSPSMETRGRLQTLNCISETQMSKRTQTSSLVIRQLDSAAFYQITVVVMLNPVQVPNSTGIGKSTCR